MSFDDFERNVVSNFSDVFDVLARYGVDVDEKYRNGIRSKLNGLAGYQPRVGVFGKTGVGKSSLCNAIFGQDVCSISDVAGCTRSPQEVVLSMGKNGITLVDVPGVGESVDRDKEYESLYKGLLPELDVVIWVIKGDDRAFSSEEKFYKKLVRPYVAKGLPFFMVLNQIDKIEPFREWNVETNMPGSKQAKNIETKREIVASAFGLPLGCVVPVSANERHGLVALVDALVHALPNEKKAVVLDRVSSENRSESAKKEAKGGFWDVIVDSVVEAIPVPAVAKDVVKKALSKVKDYVVDKVSSLFGWRW